MSDFLVTLHMYIIIIIISSTALGEPWPPHICTSRDYKQTECNQYEFRVLLKPHFFFHCKLHYLVQSTLSCQSITDEMIQKKKKINNNGMFTFTSG
jgi:hypothetical protein